MSKRTDWWTGDHIEIPVDQLRPEARDAMGVVLASEEQRMLDEIAESRRRDEFLASMQAQDEIAAEQQAEKRALQGTLARAHRRVTGAMKNVHDHLQRAEQPGLAKQERMAEESLALAAFRRIDEWDRLERRVSASLQVHEPAIYSRTAQRSWFADVALLADPDHPEHQAAADRLERYGKGLARDGGAEGMRALKVWREASRKPEDRRDASDREFRAMSTGSASGGAMVPPAYVVEDYGIYRSSPATFWAESCSSRPLPTHGMVVNVPVITGPADSGAQGSENTAPSEVDPTAAYSTQNLATYYSLVSASQQLHDRSGPVGFDSAIYSQLRQQIESNIDAAVIALAVSGATSVSRTTSTALTLGEFLADVGKAASALQTSAGTALPPSALTAAPGIGEWLLAQTTTNGDAWFKPSLGGTRSGDGITGQAVSGIGMLLDNNIPAASGNAQLLVANRGAILVYTGEPIFDVLQAGGLAGALSVQYRARAYATPVARFPKGVAVISGTGYPAAPTYV